MHTCYSSPDSVLVPIKSIYAANATADSLDWCKEKNDSLVSAIKTAQKAISQRDDAIYLLNFEVKNLNSMDEMNTNIIREKNAEIRKHKVKGWLKLALGVLVGFITYPILK